jgi:hypothetical protein
MPGVGTAAAAPDAMRAVTAVQLSAVQGHSFSFAKRKLR